ncbi:DUF2785 domain-containing protein [Heyndrickxia sporothermodurans]
MIKENLYKIINHQFALPDGLSEYEAVLQIVQILGSTDAELRDDLGYHVLSKWLLEKNFLSATQLEELLNRALSNDMLFHHIGEEETDSVFLRSFSALLIALILIRDNREQFLSESAFRLVMDRVVSYCYLEKDFRSYDEEKGWAHAPAHISDVIDECMINRFVTVDDCNKLWHGLLSLLERAPHVYDAEEDERMATAVTSMIENGKVSLSTLVDWLEEMSVPVRKDIISMNKQINMKHFIRALFFRLHAKNLLPDASQQFISFETKFNRFI